MYCHRELCGTSDMMTIGSVRCPVARCVFPPLGPEAKWTGWKCSLQTKGCKWYVAVSVRATPLVQRRSILACGAGGRAGVRVVGVRACYRSWEAGGPGSRAGGPLRAVPASLARAQPRPAGTTPHSAARPVRPARAATPAGKRPRLVTTRILIPTRLA